MPGRPIDYEGHKRTPLVKRVDALETDVEALTGTVEDLQTEVTELTTRVDSLFIPGEIRAFAMFAAPAGWLEANGATILIADYPALAAAIYCGDLINASADWGYKVASPGGSRSTSGAYLVLPDFRGEFLRGWDNSRGKDPGRSLWASQAAALASHSHSGSISSAGAHTHTASTNTVGDHAHTYQRGSVNTNNNTTTGGAGNRVTTFDESAQSTSTTGAHSHTVTVDAVGNHTHTLSVDAFGGSETRPTNLAALICIKT